MEKFLQTALDSAREAGQVALLRQKHLGPARLKGLKDLVTEADLECDHLIRDRLEAAFPDHDIVTEEQGALRKGSDYCWYVDPIDGTVNYAHQMPLWGVSIGLSHKGKMLCGAICLPALGETYTVQAGGGAFLNGEPIHVSACTDPGQAILSHGDFNVGKDAEDSLRLNGENFRAHMRFAPLVQRIKCLGSAAVEGVFIAAGRLDGYWMTKLHPWDVAVTTLLVAEAGGRVTNLRGDPWNLEMRTALFSNGLLHDALIEKMAWDQQIIPGSS